MADNMNNASQEYEWFLARDGQRYGPITNEDLRKLASTGHVKGEDLIWRQGFDEWVPASTVPGLIEDAEQDVPPVQSEPDYVQSEAQQNSMFAEVPQDELTADPVHRVEPEAPESIFNDELKAEPVVDRPAVNTDASQGQTVGYVPEMHRPRRSFMRSFFNFLLFMIILGGIAIFALPAVIPADFIREHIARIIKEETGRTLSVRGKSTFSILPYPGVRMHEVALSNPPGMSGEPLLRMESLDVQLKLMPLFEQKIEIKRITLKQPKVALRVDGQGKENWKFAKSKLFNTQTASTQTASLATSSITSDTASSGHKAISVIRRAFFGPVVMEGNLTKPKFKDIKFEEVRVVDGAVVYQDEKTGFSETFNKMNAKINLTTLSKLLIVDGSGVWNRQKIVYALSLQSPEKLMEQGNKAPYTLTLTSTLFTTYLSGELSWAGGWYVTGESSEFQVRRSVRELASWLGHDITPGSGMETFSISGNFVAQSQRIAIKNATVNLDSTTANGEASIVLSGKRPYVEANLTSDTLNLNPYFNEAPLRDTSLIRDDFRYAEQKGPSGSFRTVNQDTLSQNGNFSTGGVSSNDTSTEGVAARPINTFASSLKLFDADIQLASDRIIIEKILIGKSRLVMKVRKGILDADVAEMNLYSGKATGKFQVSSPGLIPQFAGTMKFSEVSALPLLRDSHAFKWLSGKANIDFAVSSKGHSKKQIMAALEGKGNIELVDGALEGIDLTKMIKDLKKGRVNDLKHRPSERTPFEKFDGAFSINNGVVKNSDANLKSANLVAKGNGQVDLTRDWVDYRIEHKIITNEQKDSLVVPVRIKGDISDPKLDVDLNETISKNQKTIIKGINQAAKAFKKLKKKNKKIDFESLIQEALSGGKNKSRDNNAAE